MTRGSVKRRPYRHLFGPVPSRRLGLSLGVDLVPHKVCSLDCVYCECGATTLATSERRAYVPTEDVLTELTAWFGEGMNADHITFSGAGEPTLHADIGEIARFIAARTEIPLALLTNGTLMGDPLVRRAVQPCRVILPSLDAADEETFQRINRPMEGLTVAALIESLVALRREFRGAIWLEILLIEGMNDSDASLRALGEAVRRIAPDRVQLNTAVRPGTEPDIEPAGEDVIARARRFIGENAEPVADFVPRISGGREGAAELDERLLGVLVRRPEAPAALAEALGVSNEACDRALERLEARGRIRFLSRGRGRYACHVK